MTTQQFDVIEVGARMEFDGQDDVVNTFQYRLETATPVTPANTVTDIVAILEALYTLFLVAQSTLLVYRDIRVVNKTQAVLLGTYLWPTLIAGTNIADAVPPGCCGLVDFNTIVSRVKPKKYFGAFTVGNVDFNGTWDNAMLTILTNSAIFMLAPQVGVSGTWLYGYDSPKTLGWVAPVGAVTRDVPAYQRRRKPGRGS